jgi:hypothetical protein
MAQLSTTARKLPRAGASLLVVSTVHTTFTNPSAADNRGKRESAPSYPNDPFLPVWNEQLTKMRIGIIR